MLRRHDQRLKEEQERQKAVYNEFLDEFADDRPSSASSKTFVRGEVVNPEDGTTLKGKDSSGGSRLYKPVPLFGQVSSGKKQPLIADSSSAGPVSQFERARKTAEEKAKSIMAEAASKRPDKAGRSAASGTGNSRLSNLAAFKEELKQMQEARDERRKVRKQLQDQLGDQAVIDKIAPSLDNPYLGGFDSDPNTTNLFLSNLGPDVIVEDVYEIFGKFGPLASAKVMFARTEEEKKRGYLCGFVAFMTRTDADRAVAGLKGKIINGFEMKMSWAKVVAIPAIPVFIPKEMLDMTLPPPPSHLPFNCQPRREEFVAYQQQWPIPGRGPPITPDQMGDNQREAWQKMIKNSIVKVVIPGDRALVQLIHRTIEFVVKEGPMFEAMIMQREMHNQMFRFLFDNYSPAHIYYRWKLFSILQGDEAHNWNEKEFRMFEGGSLWKPPQKDFFEKGMPRELYYLADEYEDIPRARRPRQKTPSPSSNSNNSDSDDGSRGRRRRRRRSPSPDNRSHKGLRDSDRDYLEDLLRGLTPEKRRIGEAMHFCIKNADHADEIVDCISESLSIAETPLHKKIARLYLVSDILSNCSGFAVSNISYFRKFFQLKLEEIFRQIHKALSAIGARLKAEQFKQRVMSCFRVWERQALYPTDFLIKLQNIFLGLIIDDAIEEKSAIAKEGLLDGTRLSPIDEYDIDGMPLNPNHQPASNAAKDVTRSVKGGFKKSKWDTLDPKTVEQQAVTTSKWDLLESGALDDGSKWATSKTSTTVSSSIDEDIDGAPMDPEPASFGNDRFVNIPRTANRDSAYLDGTPLSDSSGRGVGAALVRTITNVPQQTNRLEMSEEKRRQLREIEVKVVSYQDELESGSKRPAKGRTIAAEIAAFRQRLLDELEEGEVDDDADGRRHRTSIDRGKRSDRKGNYSIDEKQQQRKGSREREEARRESRRRSRSRSKSPNGVSKKSSTSDSRRRTRSRSRSPKRRRK